MKNLAVCLLALLPLLGFAQATEPIPKHMVLARELVDTVRPENNLYNATPTATGIHWASDGHPENKVDTMCSEFVGGVLKKANNTTYDMLKAYTRKTRFLHTNNFVEAVNKDILQKVQDIREVKVGDIMVFTCQQKCATAGGIPAQGHVAFVDAVPEKIVGHRPVVPGTTQWKVTLIDSTDSLHDSEDTRNYRFLSRPKATGVGRGSFTVYVDGDGKFAGYSSGWHHTYFDSSQRPLMFVRPIPQ
jgi:hypothetical protein